ncbi:hypothetical protein [Loigolactobacillus binensis]|uniref:Uncharacterized protein n=1 Tax=Loigolactobacillus binensis TaxID=2559922 RepID=A0ABW3EAD3_9LACO|nr:hypothetical protein [Loigolactobacillus binensis]
MLLDQTQYFKNIIAAQIVKVFYPFVIAKTECGQLVKLNLSLNERHDPLFWAAVQRILQAALWVPIGRYRNQLLDNGWLAGTTLA